MKISQPSRTVLLIVLPAALILLGCNFLSEGLNPATPTPVNCFDASIAPTDSDIDYALEFTADTFENTPWLRSHQEKDDRVTVTWQNKPDLSIVHMEYLNYPCGYNDEVVDAYFSQANFENVIFQNYEMLISLDTCSIEPTLRLNEFSARFGEIDYSIHYWIVLDQPTRVLDIFIAYPADQESTLNSYANQLFPSLASCQE
jgi:hypothetical protein